MKRLAAIADRGSTRHRGTDGKRTRADGPDGRRDRGAVARGALHVLTRGDQAARAPPASSIRSMILIMIESVMCEIIGECDVGTVM